MNILVSEKISAQGVSILESSGFSVDVKPQLGKDPTALAAAIAHYDALMVRSATRVDRALLDHAKSLKVIGRAGVGVDNVDLVAATERGILVINSPEGNTVAAAEHTMAMLLALVRNVPQAYQALCQGRWDRAKYVGVELYGKKLGVVGLGKIGSRVISYALAFGMEVVGYDPYVSQEYAKSLGIQVYSDLAAMVGEVDFLTLHVPVTPDTNELINETILAKAKKGLRLINVARGALVHEGALEKALRSGQVAGAALDVFASEPPPSDHPLFALPQVVVTPHLGASTVEAQVNVAVDVASQIVETLRGGTARTAVNIPTMRPDLLAPVQPYFHLAEKLGALAAQLVDSAIQSAKITYQGEVAEHEVSPLTTALVKGLLSPVLQDAVNYVNAGLVAKQRKIAVSEVKKQDGVDFANLMSVTVKTERETCRVAGSRFGTYGDRIVKIDAFRVDVAPQGYLLIVPNLDKPGMIGQIGALLGKHRINIASMEVGREEEGGRAVMVLNVDTPVPDDVLDQVRALEGIYGARLVKL